MNAKREKPGEEKEVFITKKYATMGGFMRGVRNAFIKVFGDDDNLTLIEPGEDRTVEERIRAGEFVTHAEGSKELGYKLGWEIEFPDRIYVYYTPEWKDETEEQEEKMKEKKPWEMTREEFGEKYVGHLGDYDIKVLKALGAKDEDLKFHPKGGGYIKISSLERIFEKLDKAVKERYTTPPPDIKEALRLWGDETLDGLKKLRDYVDALRPTYIGLPTEKGYGFHKKSVEEALKEGRPVPDEVLKDYPDLAEKYGEKATKLQEIPKELESLAKIARRYKNAEEFLEKFVLDPFNQKYVFTPDVRKAIVESGFITPEGVFDAESFYKQATAEKYKKEPEKEKNIEKPLSDREIRVIERLKMLGVKIDEPPIITTIGKTRTVVGKIDNYRLNFVVGDIQKEDMEEFDTLRIDDKIVWVKKSPMLTALKEKLRRGEKKPKVMKLVPEYGGLKRFERQDMTLTEKLQLKYLKEHGNL